MALQRTRRPSLRSGRSLRSLGSPLNAYPLCVGMFCSVWSASPPRGAPGRHRGCAASARKRQNHHRGEWTASGSSRARPGSGGHEIAAA
jgi:hypothetical protein